ncbi:MAG TPA: ATP-binding protein [Terriglobales bacterium]|nr:ATP-binding protein [Terriglobales bacterium]
MTGLIQKLPATLVLGILAAVFLVTCRKHSSVRVRLWVWGWGLVLSHFAIRLLEEASRLPRTFIIAADLTLVSFAGIVFVVSSSPIAEFPEYRRKFLLLVGTPAVVLSCVAATGATWWILSALAAMIMYFGPIAFFATCDWRWSPGVLALYGALAASGIASVVQAARGNTEFPALLALMWMFLLSGILFVQHYRRRTPGVITTFLGFAGWALVWAIAAFHPEFEKMLGEFSEFWNVPKYILAFGMILVLLEEEKNISDEMRQRERGLNQQLESFAEVTSRLLSGQDVRSLCGDIARIITTVTTFRRVTVLLVDEQQRLHIAGSSGVEPDVLAKLEISVRQLSPQQLADLATTGRLIGRTTYVLSQKEMEPYGSVPGKTDFGSNPFWQRGDELIVPIRSPRGTYAGFFSLDEPRELARVNETEMSKLELLADDLGVAIERAYLQRELVRTEKLAGIGQLVAGMAHELNNPLTAVLGYSEMLSDFSEDPQVRQQAGIIQRESLRMKKIIENLVRFAKQDKAERKLLSINQSLEEALKLCGYQAKSRNIDLEMEVEKDLPMVRFDEAQLKQVFLNVLGNALEAVDGLEHRKITVRAGLNHGIVSVTVVDSGLGFADPERVFDPFFTTKGVGKGPGLGLSVCYGIVKQHGGEIRAFNAEPRGAGITIEMPAAQQELALTTTV